MVRLYEAGGSSEIEILDRFEDDELWNRIKLNAARLLRARGHNDSADILETMTLELYNGTNSFNDEFMVLYKSVNVEEYVEYGEVSVNAVKRYEYKRIAEVITELGYYIRFIAVNMSIENSDLKVENPILAITSDVVEKALNDCEKLVSTNGALSGVDRIHTALHGYLKEICKKEGIQIEDHFSLVQIYKEMILRHPKFNIKKTEEIVKINKALGTVIDSLNPLRNNSSLAHPNEKLLDDTDSMLVINCVKTILQYINMKIR
jgi:hypothetical protein